MPNTKTTKAATKTTKAPAKPVKGAKAPAAKAPAKATKTTKAPAKAPVKGATTKGAKLTTKNGKTPIEGITSPALERIIERAGIVRKEAAVYPVLRKRLQERVNVIMEDVKVYLEHDDRATVYVDDLRAALESQGTILAAGLNENAKKTASLQSSTSRGKGGPAEPKEPKPEPEDDEADSEGAAKKKKTRFRPGVIARRKVRNQMKNSDNLAIPKANFARVVREAAGPGVRFAASIIDLLQLCVEEDLIALCRRARRCAEHANRLTLSPADIDLVLEIGSGNGY